jgi:hypothetical protein
MTAIARAFKPGGSLGLADDEIAAVISSVVFSLA